MVRKNIVKVNDSAFYKISLKFDNIETSLLEQFRADFNNDGIEDIVRTWIQFVGGTMGWRSTMSLTKYSDTKLMGRAY